MTPIIQTPSLQQQSLVQVPGKRRWRFQVLLFELRWTFSWTWLLPVMVIALSFLLTKATFTPLPPDLPVPKGTVVLRAPDYATHLRRDLELFLPLVSIFLTISLLAQEWQRGTLVQLGLRRSLLRVLGERLAFTLIYLTVLTVIATIVSFAMTEQHLAPDTTLWPWLWNVCITVLPATFLLTALGLLCAHLTVSATTGYIAAAAIWLGNIFSPLFVPANNAGSKSDILLYLLFGWQYRESALHPDHWIVGKLVLLAITLVLLLLQIFVLRHEARFIRNQEE